MRIVHHCTFPRHLAAHATTAAAYLNIIVGQDKQGEETQTFENNGQPGA